MVGSYGRTYVYSGMCRPKSTKERSEGGLTTRVAHGCLEVFIWGMVVGDVWMRFCRIRTIPLVGNFLLIKLCDAAFQTW
jgi:hypothetical protein